MPRKKPRRKGEPDYPSRRIEQMIASRGRFAWPDSLGVADVIRFHIAVLSVQEMFLSKGVPVGVDGYEYVGELFRSPSLVNKCALALTFGSVDVPRFSGVPGDDVLKECFVNFGSSCMRSLRVEPGRQEFVEAITFSPRGRPDGATPADSELLDFSERLLEVEMLWDAAFQISDAEVSLDMRITRDIERVPRALVELGREVGADSLVMAWGAGVPLDDVLVGTY